MTKPPNGRVPIGSCNSEVIWTTVVRRWLSFPTPYCSFPRLSLLSPACHAYLRDTLLASSMLFREYALYASDLHLPSLCITRSQMSPPATSVVAPPIRDECKANLSGLRPDSATTFLTARRVRPYHTTLTELPNRYEARGG